MQLIASPWYRGNITQIERPVLQFELIHSCNFFCHAYQIIPTRTINEGVIKLKLLVRWIVFPRATITIVPVILKVLSYSIFFWGGGYWTIGRVRIEIDILEAFTFKHGHGSEKKNKHRSPFVARYIDPTLKCNRVLYAFQLPKKRCRIYPQ